MSKSIKVNEDVYYELITRQRARETFSEEIRRLLDTAIILEKAEPLLRGQAEMYRERIRKAEHSKEKES